MTQSDKQKPKDIVRDGFNRASLEVRGDRIDENCYNYIAWLDMFTPLLHKGAKVLDLGCGNGIPAAKLLVERGFSVTGVDISEVQISRAKELVPQGFYICCDMATLDFQPSYFHAVISLHAVTHLPLEQQPLLLARVANWMKRGGYFLFTGGISAWTGTDENWKGVRMFWSHADQQTYCELLGKLGFDLLWTSYEKDRPEGEDSFTLFLAKKK